MIPDIGIPNRTLRLNIARIGVLPVPSVNSLLCHDAGTHLARLCFEFAQIMHQGPQGDMSFG
jgi:hypothetical protein